MRTYDNLRADPPKHISDIRELFKTSAEVFGEKVQYYYKEGEELLSFSYNDFYNSMNYFGTALAHLGLMHKRIAIIGDTHPHWVTTFASVICGGGVAVPIDKELEINEIISFMKIAGCSAVVYTGCFNKRLVERADDMPFIDYFIPIHDEECVSDKVIPHKAMLDIGRKLLEEGDKRYLNHEIDMDALCTILFTSGTTGSSKGVMLSQRNFTTSVMDACTTIKYDSKTVLVSVLPIHHTYELTCGHLAASNLGTTTYINENLKYASRNFKNYKPTGLVLVPLFLETVHKKIWEEIRKKGIEKKVHAAMKLSAAMLKANIDIRDKLFSDVTSAFGGRLTCVIVGGAAIDPQIIRDFYYFGINVIQGYGITECSPLVAVTRIGKVEFDSVGQSVDGCEVKIEQIDGCAEGEGEILVKGNNVMLGYYENPEATAEVFTEDGFFRTGDIGTIDKKGYIRITGRKKNVIIASNGKNVFPEEIEERLLRSPLINEVVVIGRKGSGFNDVTITAIVFPNLDAFGEDRSYEDMCGEIKKEITSVNQTLPSYKHIGKFEVRMTEFEKTPSKKIKRYLIN